MAEINKELFLRWLEGQRRMNEIVEHERMDRLARITPQEALCVFDDLCSTWRPLPPDEQRALDELKLETMIRVRRSFTNLRKAEHHE